MNQHLLSKLSQLCPGQLIEQADLSQLSRWRVGGRARLLIRPQTESQVVGVLSALAEFDEPYIVIGATSNLLFDDRGLDVICVQIGSALGRIDFNGTEVTAEAGIWVPGLARKLMLRGLTGAEHTCGIPGTLGGLVCMNGGSQRKGIGSHIVSVRSVTRSGEIQERVAEDCGFAYRESIFQRNGEIILSVKMRFQPVADQKRQRSEMLSILRERRSKFPQRLPNCGSVFKSNPAMYEHVGPPGAVIEQLGLKGAQIGQAIISPQHSNFIVNAGGASAQHILALISMVQHEVESKTGYKMVPEAGFVTCDGRVIDPVVAFDELFAHQPTEAP